MTRISANKQNRLFIYIAMAMAKGSRALKGKVNKTQVSKTVFSHLELLYSVGNIPHTFDAKIINSAIFLIMLQGKN